MWIAKIILRHDCILGNRCRKYKVICQALDLNEEKSKNKVLTTSIHQLIGDKISINKFVNDLKKDKRVYYIEFNRNTLFLIDTAKMKPVSQFTRKMFFVKPVIINEEGYENWEIASHKKEGLSKFISKVKPLVDEFDLIYIKETKLNNIYFPKIMPELTDLQKKALELAIEKGYYQTPKKIGLRELAKLMNISLATYQKHLQKAESKVIPDVISMLK